MPVTPLTAFTWQQSSTIVALGSPNAFPIPTGSSPTMMLVENLGAEEAEIGLTTPAATTTATQTKVGSTTIVVANASGIAVGQIALAAGLTNAYVIPISNSYIYPNGTAVTYVTGISGTTITLSAPTIASMSGTTINFVAQLTIGTGIVVQPHIQPTPLAIGSNTYIQTICKVFSSNAVLNVSVGV